MHGFDDILDAGPGEERDAILRALAEDMWQAVSPDRRGRGFVKAERPADLAKALGRDRRRARPVRLAS
ncbi:hypothetical protein MKK55_18065 [Methylobacterium sp. J-059]|uniref:hypothetical protein n=1 Tax=Methylobacterium sp. J-059 TaxID=2836643 RepID=UPI001FBA58EB|nr:hypothetical protein [Methylobacterium sp. J-059]MCJ2040839.1 hypothetical protein [Methylobacterium sp. J-059]